MHKKRVSWGGYLGKSLWFMNSELQLLLCASENDFLILKNLILKNLIFKFNLNLFSFIVLMK